MSENDGRSLLQDRRDYGPAIARIEQGLVDQAASISDLKRKAEETSAAYGRIEAKVAAIEAVVQNGLASMVREMSVALGLQGRKNEETHILLSEHVVKEDFVLQMFRDDRALSIDIHRRMVTALVYVGAAVLTTALGVIGYLFHLHFGQA